MAMDFPLNPTNGQVYQNFYFDSSIGTWRNLGSKNALSSAVTDLQAGTKKIASYDSAAARASAVPTPTESMVSYLADSNAVEVYDGSAWKQVYPSVANTGEIVQVVSTTKTSSFTVAISNGAFSANVTGLEATITPKSSANKIIVTVDTTLSRIDGRAIGGFRIVRNGTAIGIGDAASTRPRLTSGIYNDFYHNAELSPVSSQFVDSPATTSAVTYGIQLYGAGATTFTLNRSGVDTDAAAFYRTISTITLTEVVG